LIKGLVIMIELLSERCHKRGMRVMRAIKKKVRLTKVKVEKRGKRPINLRDPKVRMTLHNNLNQRHKHNPNTLTLR